MSDPISNFSELHCAVMRYRNTGNTWIFRGQEADFPLVPSIGRYPYILFEENEFREEHTFRSWKSKSKELLRKLGKLSDIEIMAMAQHHNCHTRLLDWTYNPLIAAFFAVRKTSDSDSVIYCLKDTGELSSLGNDNIKPFELPQNIILYDPGSLTQRILSQSGVFTVHKQPRIPLSEVAMIKDDMIHKLVISKDYRDELLKELSFYNFHDWTLFPDLDGLGKRLTWQYRDTLERGRKRLDSFKK